MAKRSLATVHGKIALSSGLGEPHLIRSFFLYFTIQVLTSSSPRSKFLPPRTRGGFLVE